MKKELFEAIGQQAIETVSLKVVHPKEEPDHVYYTVDKSGLIERHSADPKPRDHKAYSLAPIITRAADEKTAVIWFCRETVVLLMDDDNRRDRITLALNFSEPLKIIMGGLSKAFSQKELVLLLRAKFRDCLERSGELISIIRNVKFQINQQGGTEIAHGKSSVGKALQMELTGAGTIPEYITLMVPIFDNSGLNRTRYPITLALEPDAATQTFQLMPLPGEVENAIAAGEEHIGELLSQQLEGTTILYGKA